MRPQCWLVIGTLAALPGVGAYYKPAFPKVSPKGRPSRDSLLSAHREAPSPSRHDAQGGPLHNNEGSRPCFDATGSNRLREERLRGALYLSSTSAPPTEGRRKLLGAKNFVRKNPKSDRFQVLG